MVTVVMLNEQRLEITVEVCKQIALSGIILSLIFYLHSLIGMLMSREILV